ncbi:hypothetical protein LOAG_04678 [Loa loa]|uniref:Uncharacterized protein n=1 Tax=Loa loa TaxID=7209 RepID=A0A1S0U1N0_LOALO|nr:hypothetical protein LOAG_04678 [Loa loa]EFO23812.1 hypothetical protein LOAG_04678 [Loa loa]
MAGAILTALKQNIEKSSDSHGECLTSAQDKPPKPTKWDEVLVDEVDFIEALKTGRISKDDCHIASINKEILEDSGDVEEAKISFHDDILTDDEKMSDVSSIDILI